jgi:hypothetical protein
VRLDLAISPAVAIFLGGCGLGVSQLPEVWDRTDPYATAHMEVQIKRAIFCELRRGALETRRLNSGQYSYGNTNVTSAADLPLPDSWGVQVTLTLTVDEKSNLTPSVSWKNPIAPVSIFSQNVSQSYTTTVGGQLSSENIRYDKYNFYYTARDLIDGAGPGDICGSPPTAILGRPSLSSPFVNASDLGISDWLPGAVFVTDFQRSSRAAATGEGAPLGSSGSFASDSITYDNKFVIISDVNAAPTWNLVRLGTGTSALLDLNRTRTHELLITIGPGSSTLQVDAKTGKKVLVNAGPSSAAVNSHLASEIGSAVASAIRPQN